MCLTSLGTEVLKGSRGGPAERRGHATCDIRGVTPPLAVLWALRGLDPFLLLSPPCLRRTGRRGRADAYIGHPVGSALLFLLRLSCPRQPWEMPFLSPF